MTLSQLRFRDFVKAVARVNQMFADDIQCTELLNAAREDSPIIDELLREMALVLAVEPSNQFRRDLCKTMERDLTVLLAMRELAKGATERMLCSASRFAAN